MKKVDILPYHKLRVYKWEALSLEYALKDVNPPSDEEVDKAYQNLTKVYSLYKNH